MKFEVLVFYMDRNVISMAILRISEAISERLTGQ
jgi:hypothetical protein